MALEFSEVASTKSALAVTLSFPVKEKLPSKDDSSNAKNICGGLNSRVCVCCVCIITL